MTTRIYTRTGDSGTTGLFGGQRVSKDDVRVAAYGAVDELCAALGLVLAHRAAAQGAGAGDAEHGIDASTVRLLTRVQADLFELGGELATPDVAKRTTRIVDADIEGLERAIDDAEAELSPLTSFILPGGATGAAQLHVARGVCRRAERACVSLMAADPGTSSRPLVYLNRLSDLLFVLARRVNARAGIEDTPWHPRDGS